MLPPPVSNGLSSRTVKSFFPWARNLANVFGDKVTGPAAKLKATKGEGG